MHAVIEFTNRIGESFVHFSAGMLLQSSILICVLLALDLLMRRRVRSIFRYWIWCLVLVKLVLPPTIALPTGVGWWLGGTVQTPQVTALPAPQPTEVAPLPVADTPVYGPARQLAMPRPIMTPSDVPSYMYEPGPVDVPHMAPAASAPHVEPTLGWPGIVLIVYLVCVVVLLLLIVQRARNVRHIVRQSRVADAPLQKIFTACCRTMPVAWPIQLRISSRLSSPAVCGLVRPVVLVPDYLFTVMDRAQLEAVFLHELAHVQRQDTWVNLVQILLQAAYFYNPLVWVANLVIRRVREEAVDEMVLVAMGENAQEYPASLIKIARLALAGQAVPLRMLGVVESKSALAQRFRHIMEQPLPKTARCGLAGLIAIALAAAVLLPMATRAAQPAQKAPAAATQPAAPEKVTDAPSEEGKATPPGQLRIGPMPKALLASKEYQGMGLMKPLEPKPSFCRSDRPLLWQDKRSKYASALLFDQSGGPGTPYDTLFVDFDGNRDFDGDMATYKEEVTDQPADQNRDGTFLSVKLAQVSRPDVATPTTVIFKQYRKQIGGPFTYGGRIIQSTWASGTIAFGRHVVPVAILDRNGNGRFTDQGGFAAASDLLTPQCDFLALVLDGSTAAPSGEVWSRAIQLPLGHYLVLNSGTYRLTAKAEKDRVQLTAEPVELPAGKFQVPSELRDGRLQLLGEKTVVLLTGVKESVVLPADTYRMTARKTAPVVVAPQDGLVAGPPMGDAKDVLLVGKPAQVRVRVVKRGTDEPLAGVDVKIMTWGSAGTQTNQYVTDAKGECAAQASDIGMQSMKIQVASTGMVPMAVRWDSGAGALPQEYTFPMEPGTTIGCTITDEQGKPIEDAVIHLLVPRQGPDTAPYPDIYDVTFRTDKQGRWKCDYAPAELNDVWLRLEHLDYASDNRFGMTAKPPIEKLRDRTGVMILKKGLTLSGVVVGPEGKPVGGAAVKQGRNRPGSNYPSTETDKEGKFTFPSCKAEVVVLTTMADGLSPDVREISVTSAIEPVRIELAPAHRLTARVVDEQGRPVAATMVFADSWRGYRSLEWQSTTDAQGRFVWNSAPADAVLFDILKPGYMNVRNKSLTAADDEQVVTLALPLHISGKVVDAATSQPIPQFQMIQGIDWGDNRTPYWSRDDMQTCRNGLYDVAFSFPRPGHLLRVEAPGYNPAVSRVFRSDEGQQTYDFALEKGKDLTGTVFGVDGKVLPAARVLMAMPGQPIRVSNGRDAEIHNAMRFKTDRQGKFRVPSQTQAYVLVVIHNAGFAKVADKEFEADPRLQLKAWGRVEGVLRIGAAPAARKPVALSLQEPSVRYDPQAPQVNFSYDTQTDDQGRFAFERVVPGEVSVMRAVKTGDRTDYTHGVSVTVEPGTSAQVTIGGTGRPLVGKVRMPTDDSRKVNWIYSQNFISTKTATIEPPAEVKEKGQEALQQWYDQWQHSEQGKAWRLSQRYFNLFIQQDGTFRVEDIPAGTYNLNIRACEPPAANQGGFGELIGSAAREFTVPDMEGGRSDEPLDIGTLELTVFRQAKVGAMAPPFEVVTLDDKPLKLSDYRGKYVLLDFWATWCGPCRGETPYLKAVHDKHGQDSRLVIVSLSLDPEQKQAKEYAATEKTDWPQGFLGEWSKTKLPAEYGVRGIPAIFLIGPDGKIVDKDLRGDAIEAAVAKALAK